MNTLDLARNLRNNLGVKVAFWGIFCSDELLNLVIEKEVINKPIVLIVNTLRTFDDREKMGHWVCFHFTRDKAVFFDSFGLDPRVYCREFYSFVEKTSFNWFRFKVQLQPPESIKCGLYSFMFCHYLSYHELLDTVKFIREMFSERDKFGNDFVVSQYFIENMKDPKCSIWRNLEEKAITYNECLLLTKRYFLSLL